MAVKCWASELGGCCNTQSREHIISKGLFQVDEVIVVRPGEEPRRIPVKRLVRKVLCHTHNQMLSSLADQPAKLAIEAFRKSSFRAEEVRLEPRRRFGVLKQEIDGLGLERWLLKTSISICYRKLAIYPEESLTKVPLSLVGAAYGQRLLTGTAGLYIPVSIGLEIRPEEGYRYDYLMADERRVRGLIFRFRGVPFTIWLDEAIPPPPTSANRTIYPQMRHIARIKDPRHLSPAHLSLETEASRPAPNQASIGGVVGGIDSHAPSMPLAACLFTLRERRRYMPSAR